MPIRIPRSWELSENLVTPEAVYLDRRSLGRAAAAGSILAAGLALPGAARAARSRDAPHFLLRRPPPHRLRTCVPPSLHPFCSLGRHRVA